MRERRGVSGRFVRGRVGCRHYAELSRAYGDGVCPNGTGSPVFDCRSPVEESGVLDGHKGG